MPRSRRRASGTVADLLSAGVGFSGGWGLSRSLVEFSGDFVGESGCLDWARIDQVVAGAVAELLGRPAKGEPRPPRGAREIPAELYMGVAVSEHASGWAGLARAGRNGRARRLVHLRCHVGRRRRGRGGRNLVLLQYRAWRKSGTGPARRSSAAAETWPLVADLHAVIEGSLAGRTDA